MAVKKVIYKEPADYFTPAMKKAAAKWERENAKKTDAKKAATKKKK